MSSDFLKFALDGVIALVNGLDNLIDTVGTLPTLIGIFAAFESFNGIGFFKTIEDEASASGKRMANIFSAYASETKNAFNSLGIKTNKEFGNSLRYDTQALMGFKKAVADGVPVTEAFASCMAHTSESAKNLAKSGNVTNKQIIQWNKNEKALNISTIASNKSLSSAKAIMQEYNSGCKNSVLSQKEFVSAVGQGNSGLGKYLSGLNGANATMGGYIKSLVGATLKTVVLEAATMALNAAITMGISFLISAGISAITKWINAKKELAEEVEELTSKYKEEHDALKKLESDYDTSNESSMVSRYEKLSKGVSAFGKNISLTVDEYSEYQDIVNKIAEQLPSMVSGYDEQGNAILSCKGNVEQLTEAYEKLIHAQNQEILSRNAGNIEKDWENTISQANGYDSWENLGNSLSFDGLFGGELNVWDMKTDTAKWLSGLSAGTSKEIIKDALMNDSSKLYEIIQALQGAGYDVNAYSSANTVSKVLKEALEDEPQKIQGILDNYYAGFDAAVAEYKTIATAKLSEAFDISSAVSGVNYSNISEELQNIAYQTVNSLDFDFLNNLSKQGKSIEDWTTEMLDQLNSISKTDSSQIESAFELQTQFNGGDISYGEYVKGLEDIELLMEKLDLDPEVENQIKLSLNTEEITNEYDSLMARLTGKDNKGKEVENGLGFSEEDAKNLLEGLTSSELSALRVKINSEIDLESVNLEEFRQQIKKEAELIEAMNFKIAVDVEAEGIDALNTAIAESVSATGLSSESITALKSRYAELESQGYDLASAFEETSNGVRLNRKSVNELEKAYATNKLSEAKDSLIVLKDRYDELTGEIKNCSDASKRADLYSERQDIKEKINDLATLTSQYEGLTSAYNEWQNAESAGSERDMYENTMTYIETVKDEVSRGWYDDATIEWLELMTGKDLSSRNIDKIKSAWQSAQKTAKKYYQVNKDGDITNAGVYNFLDDVEELESKLKAVDGYNISDLVTRDDDGKIAFDFRVVGGEKAVADALGISEELVSIIIQAAKDAGFNVKVTSDYSELADMEDELNKNLSALEGYKNKGNAILKNADLDFDFGVSTVEGLTEQYEKALKILNSYDGDTNAQGYKEAFALVTELAGILDSVQSTYIDIETSDCQQELKPVLTSCQEIEKLASEKRVLELKGDADGAENIHEEMLLIAEEIAELDDEVLVKMGLDADATSEEILEAILNGEIDTSVFTAELTFEEDVTESLNDLSKSMQTWANYQLDLISKTQAKAAMTLNVDSSAFDGMEDKKIEKVVDLIVDDDDVKDWSSEQKSAYVQLVAQDEDIVNWKPEEKEALVNYVVNDGDVSTWTPEMKKAYVDYAVNDKDVASYTPEQMTAWVELLAEDSSVANWQPEKKKAYVDYITNDEDVQKYTPEQKQALVEFFANTDDPDSYNPTEKKAIVDYLANTREPDEYTPEEKEAITRFIKNSSEPDKYQVDPKTGLVTFNKDSSKPDSYQAPNPEGTVTFNKDTTNIDTWKPVVSGIAKFTASLLIPEKVKTALRAVGISIADGTANANGTAYSQGTTGRAFKQGDWRTKKTETALTGELGTELVVTGNRWFTVGDNGAEFAKIPKGSIVFNHRQTEELFKNGKVTSDGGRGKMLANGTAFTSGTAYSNSSIGYGGAGRVDSYSWNYTPSSSSKSSSSSSDSSNEFEETLDWIQTKIERIERAINNLDQTANNVYKSWSKRNKALVNEIGVVKDEITTQEAAYNAYMKAANSVGLSSSWKKKVQNGKIDIDTIKDEDLADKISEYQKWFELALECKDAIEELKETEASLYAQRVENVASQYEGVLGVIEHEKNMLDEYISQTEANAMLVSANYYKALSDNEKDNVAQLKKEKAAMLDELEVAMKSGTIDRYSEKWYEMVASIDSVTLAIAESETALKEYAQTIQQLKFEQFDLLQEKISAVTEETDFLIELLSNDKLYDDKGRLTDEGSATLGLHGVAYNINMAQADAYAEEATKLKKELAKDPYDTQLEERYREMISLQQEYILAAENSKDAIRDLVEEGIQLELDALDEKISKYEEALDSQKD